MREMALVACVAAVAAVPVFARSITGASFTQEGAETTVSVTFEAGESGDDHALYVAYDVQDRGATLVDAATFNSTNIFVQAGAHLGGTGTVARATIEAGGGFTAAPGQTRPLTLTAATLPADGVVTLDVPYTDAIHRSSPVIRQ